MGWLDDAEDAWLDVQYRESVVIYCRIHDYWEAGVSDLADAVKAWHRHWWIDHTEESGSVPEWPKGLIC